MGDILVTDLFTTLEQKLELVLSQIAGLKETNAALKKSLGEKNKSSKMPRQNSPRFLENGRWSENVSIRSLTVKNH